jgi:hypothetical protein
MAMYSFKAAAITFITARLSKLVFYGFGITDTVVDINTDVIVAVAAANKALLHFLLGQS